MTSLVAFQRYDGDGPVPRGHWKPVEHEDARDHFKAITCCPTCGNEGSIKTHKVAADGVVTPSLVCWNQCGFHEWVKLEGWKEQVT